VVEIYDRWGEKVFSSVGYENKWDGTRNNETLPAGTYYFVIDFKNGGSPKKGAITILR
jgi:gliding motility-associated-like protein